LTSHTDAGMNSLEDRRILVVGASSGVGRLIGHLLSESGARVAFAARRVEVCREEARKAANAAIGLRCDVSDPDLCDQVVQQTVEQLGGLDDVVYCAGLIVDIALVEADATCWRKTFDTNVVGASLITRAALPHLQQSLGTVVYVSSVAAHVGTWPGVGVYASTKAALNRMIDTWRSEHPELGFARIAIGPTNSESTAVELHKSFLPHMGRWADLGLVSGALIPAHSIARQVITVLTDPSRIWDVTVQPRDPARPWRRVDPADFEKPARP
jgi:NAD(P)-dependent dehydrogenase (short-subunit alcohol dehydrogenase family)